MYSHKKYKQTRNYYRQNYAVQLNNKTTTIAQKLTHATKRQESDGEKYLNTDEQEQTTELWTQKTEAEH